MRKSRWICLVALVAVILAGSIAQAQEDYAAAMAAAATPGPQHQFLAALCGTWDLTIKSWSQPGAEAVVQQGRSVSRPILGGRYFLDELEVKAEPMPFEGVGLSGYDNVRGEYFGIWVDNMGTGQMVMRGQMDPAGKVMTMTASFLDPLSKVEMAMRTVTTYDNPDHYVSEFFLTMPGGSEFKTMEMTGQRVK